MKSILTILISIAYTYDEKEIDMNTVTVSPKYQVVIPKTAREQTGLHPGEKLHVICFDDRIELVRVRPMIESRGFLRGLDPVFARDEEDRM